LFDQRGSLSLVCLSRVWVDFGSDLNQSAELIGKISCLFNHPAQCHWTLHEENCSNQSALHPYRNVIEGQPQFEHRVKCLGLPRPGNVKVQGSFGLTPYLRKPAQCDLLALYEEQSPNVF
jgi:hypothetical protein